MGHANDPSRFAIGDDGAAAARPLRVTFVITDLDVGGAEMMLWKLLSRIDRARFEPSVIVLHGHAARMVDSFRALGIACELLDWKPGRRLDVLRGLRQLSRALDRACPDVVQGWMYHGNIGATLVTAWRRGAPPVLWNVRASLMERRLENPLTLLLIRAGGKLAYFARRIVNNSLASAVEHEERMGYPAAKRVIVPNGFDVTRYCPSHEARAALRGSLGLPDDAIVVGMVARHHPMKDHVTFARAAGIVAAAHPEVRFVLVGLGVEPCNKALVGELRANGVLERTHLLGPRDDVAAIVPAFDIQVSSSSSGEGFPNVVGEAMCCAVPCVVTDVGESAAVVGDTGIVVPPRDATALAAGIAELIALGRDGLQTLGRRARARAVDRYSLDAMVRQYEALYLEVHRERKGL
jgi:glycosyltransferase involved in cell wall biosynthesis